jgi:DNA-directed RNA polymerase beta subunit
MVEEEVPKRRADVSETKPIKLLGEFKSTIPILVGSKWCKSRALAQTPAESWLIGEDPTDIGGYVIVDGQAKTVGAMYTHIPNFGMFVHTQYKTEEARADLMVRRDPFYGNTYHLLPTMTKPTRKLKDRKSHALLIRDLVIEIPWNQKDMNAKETGGLKQHLSRIPIEALFRYYGCTNNEEIQNYIFPGVEFSDARVKVLIDAMTKGAYHLKYREESAPYSPEESLLFIGKTILAQNTKDTYLREVTKDLTDLSSELKLPPTQWTDVTTFLVNNRIKERTKEILSSTFFFNINHDKKKVCQAMGSIVARLINMYLGIEPGTDRNATYNRRVQAIGEQLVIEAKMTFRKEVVGPISDQIETALFKKKDWNEIVGSFAKEIKDQVKASGPRFGKKIKQAFKSTGKTEGKQPMLLGEVYDPKSVFFLYSKFNEVLIRPAMGEKDATVVFERRRAHPSQMVFTDSTQTPDSGADVGRYNQPTIFTFLTMCQSERSVRSLLGMKDINHPSPIAGLEVPSIEETISGTEKVS